MNKKHNFRRLFLLSTFVLLLAPMMAYAQDEGGVRTFINHVAQSLIDTMKNTSTSESYKRGQIKKVIDENFDVAWMSKFTIGVHYDKLSNDQKANYASLYLNYLLNNYFPILMKYDSQDSYEILRIQKVDQTDYDIKIKLSTTKSENPIMLNYRVRSSDTNYKCLDMIVEGVSTLISQRAEFQSIIQNSDVNSFLKQLAAHKVKSIEYNTGE